MTARDPAILRRLAAVGFALLVTAAAGPAPRTPVAADHGMVVTAQHLASEVGAEILKQGGNAVDAAVAVGYALAVVHPCCGNLGGGGFMLVHLADGSDQFLNFRETAPAAATAAMYLDAAGKVVPKLSLVGHLAVGVPGTVLGLETARQRWGTMPRAALIAPAIQLAEAGFELGEGDTQLLAAETEGLKADPGVAAIFLKDGRPYRPGERLVQADLARTLRTIADGGADAFYRGPIAAAVAVASAAHGGILTAEDFARYTVTLETPIRCGYRGYRLVTAPPPSSGGVVLCELLNILEGYDLHALGFHTAASVHVMAEAMRHAYVDRNNRLGDPAFVRNPVEQLLSTEYAARIRSAIRLDRATPSDQLGPGTPPHEGVNTTHYSVVDRAGNAVAVTYTINAFFGARVIAGDTGFLLNDEMDDFTAKPGEPNGFGLVQSDVNAIAPGKRPLSSMTPTLLTRDGHVVLVTGSVGGPRIITGVLESIVNVIDHGMDIQAAADAPRFHHQWKPDRISVEAGGLPPEVEKALAAMGHSIADAGRWGSVQAIQVDGGRLLGGSDGRYPAGAAVGY